MPLATKVRWKPLLVLLILCLAQVTQGNPKKCDKTPDGQEAYKTPGDNGFSVSVAGSPSLYRPGQVYTITLKGTRLNDGGIEPTKIKFIDFTLVAESNLPSTEVANLGTFQLMPGDAMSKFSHKCSHAVKATSAIPKDEVTVLWTAPEHGDGCIQLKAMVVERKDLWYMDDGGLTHTFCEDDSPMGQPPLVEPCCACHEAKYEVIFEGLWSRHTHPKDYPIDEWKTQFSHMIGASHSIDYDLWKYSEPSSPALALLAEEGKTKKLEIDMKRFSKNIRSVIKARGLQQRSNVVGRTFAVFRMDPTNHLLSLVSKMIPSPDWIVGVSMENLCLANCSWVDSRVVDLYPWDAGVRSGMTYNDPGDYTTPKESIHRITACNPDSEESPFFDPSCAPLKPVARLHILKQREYKKQCSGGQDQVIPLNPSWGNPNTPIGNNEDVYSGTGIGPAEEISTGESYGDYGNSVTYNDVGSSNTNSYSDNSYSSSYGSNGDLCQMKEWTTWSECSQTCGMGSQSRTRVYVNPIGSKIANCPEEKLFSKRTCQNRSPCPSRSYGGNYDPFFGDDELSQAGISSPWHRRGLSSDNLKKDETLDLSAKSYVYDGKKKSGTTSYTYESVPDPEPYSDPYHDPYNKHSGYAKQKGYPPKTNNPGSSRYNPYKEMGFYGYTYGGPSTHGLYSNPAAYQPIAQDLNMLGQLQGDSTSSSCETEEWGDWSDCSSECGDGTRSRKRYYKDQDTATCSEELYQSELCHESFGCEELTADLPSPQRRTRYEKKQSYTSEDPQCGVAQWSEWSPCSVSCGHGYNIRTRVFTLSFVPNRVCEGVRLTEKKDCRLPTCWNSRTTLDYYDDVAPSYALHDTVDSDPVVEVMDEPKPKEPYCQEDPDPGPCRMEFSRWYYDWKEENCVEFKYSGCGGNRNSFVTLQSCLESCHNDGRKSAFKDLMSMSLVREDYQADAPQRAPVEVPCQVSDWSDWSACSVSCGRGWATKTREIIAEPQNGGRACPRKLSKRKKCRGDACATRPSDWYQGNWRMLQDDDDNDI